MVTEKESSSRITSALQEDKVCQLTNGSSCAAKVSPAFRWKPEERAVYFAVDLPGVEKDHIIMELTQQHLVISAKRIDSLPYMFDEVRDNGEKDEFTLHNLDQVKNQYNVKNYVLYLRFLRPVAHDNVSPALLHNGVLFLKIPFRDAEKSLTRRILVK